MTGLLFGVAEDAGGAGAGTLTASAVVGPFGNDAESGEKKSPAGAAVVCGCGGDGLAAVVVAASAGDIAVCDVVSVAAAGGAMTC